MKEGEDLLKWIIFIVFVLLSYLLIFSLCRAAGKEDQYYELKFMTSKLDNKIDSSNNNSVNDTITDSSTHNA